MEQYRRPAILLRRPYPPLDLPPRNSRLGGRPRLPDELDWPRADSGMPLHFLAQIDCAELPPSGGALPESGVLFFFLRSNGELNWEGKDEPAQNYCRVLYAPALGGRETDPPPGLPAFQPGRPDPQAFRVPGDPPVGIYPSWPVEFFPIQSWPDGRSLPWIMDPALEDDPEVQERALARLEEYQATVKAAQNAEIAGTLRPRPRGESGKGQWSYMFPTPDLFFPAADGDRPFPQVWVMIERIARLLGAAAVEREGQRPAPTGDLAEALQQIKSGAAEWVAQAFAHGLDTETDPKTAQDFSEWLRSMARQTVGGKHEFATMAQQAIKLGMRGAVQFAATAPSAAARIPHAYYAENVDHGTSHQMLGFTAPLRESGEVMLLHLRSDAGVDFMFGDAGDITFWIPQDDLVARRFQAAFATVGSS
jgi:hypothetical protein